ASLTAVAAFGIGCMVQANSISAMVSETWHVSPWVTGVIMTVVPAVDILGCLILLVMKADTLPETFRLILTSAWTGQAAVGGFMGAGVREAIRYGIARGLFSNESGLGRAPIVGAAAPTKNPVRQAPVSSPGTFWDTVVVCLMTGLVVGNSMDWTKGLNGAAL